MKNLYFIIMILFVGITYGQTKDVRTKHLPKANFFAKSSINDSLAIGGFSESNNLPKSISNDLNFSENGLILKIDTSKIITFAEINKGYNFYIANKTDSILRLKASDSRLYIIAEAFLDKKWQAIEYLPSSLCGNSDHHVYLKPEEYWEFHVPKFEGNTATKIRYKLMLDNNNYVYSNEINARINKKQVRENLNYKPFGFIDPPGN